MAKTHKQIVADRHAYYMSHLKRCRENSKRFAANNPGKVKIYQDRFTKKNPFYRRDKKRNRVAITDELIFQFIDNSLERDMKDYITYLRSRGVPEQHIRWFRVDVLEHLPRAQAAWLPTNQIQSIR